MQLLGLSVVLLLISTSYGQDTALATEIVANPLSTSVIIAFPISCQYSMETAILNISGKSERYNFTVPQCRLKRDVVVIHDPESGNVETVNVGYQVLNLTANTYYEAFYMINGQKFSPVNFTTVNASVSPPVVFARSGGMVVITVLLSIAMFLLLVGLIVILVLGGKGKK